jgi:hypothetical protein
VPFLWHRLRQWRKTPRKKLAPRYAAQKGEFDRAQDQRDKASAPRRKSFDRAQAADLTVRDIAEETGLGFGRVAEMLRGE